MEREEKEGEAFQPSKIEAVTETERETRATGREESIEGIIRHSGSMGSDSGIVLLYTDDNEENYFPIFDNAQTKTDEEDHRRVIEAIKNLNEGIDLETYVDVGAVLRYLAAHTIVANSDSYSGSMGHKYLLYENNWKISMLLWNYNMAFSGFAFGDAAEVVIFPIDTPVSGVNADGKFEELKNGSAKFVL